MEIEWLPKADNEVARMCVSAFKSGMPIKDLELLMAEVSFGYLESFKPRSLPGKPAILVQFEEDKKSTDWSLKQSKEKAEIYNKINRKKEVVDYMDDKVKIVSRMYSHAIRLEDMIKIFLSVDEVIKARKCWDVYAMYPEILTINQKDSIWEKRTKWK